MTPLLNVLIAALVFNTLNSQALSRQQLQLDNHANNQQVQIIKVRQQQHQQQYGVVVDCGSSGTRATIYTWPRDTPTGELAQAIEPLRNPLTNRPLGVRIRPGLASTRDTPTRASDYMEPIMEFIKRNVPSEQHAHTRIYLMGTAGMRLLEPQEQQAILYDLEYDLQREHELPQLRAEVISGLEEGVFQWVSVNALAARLTSEFDLPGSGQLMLKLSKNLRLGANFRRRVRLGLIEVGGASAQVAFEVDNGMNELVRRRLGARNADAWQAFRTSGFGLDLYGDRAPDVGVFAVSFLGFGSDTARSLAVDLLIRDSLPLSLYLARFWSANSTIVLDDPCLAAGAEETVSKPLDVIYGWSKTIGYLDSNSSNNNNKLFVRLQGSGNYARCSHLLKRLVLVARRERTTCTIASQSSRIEACEAPLIGTNFVPWREMQFVGLGELFYTRDQVLKSPSGAYDAHEMLSSTVRLCATRLHELNLRLEPKNEFERRRNLLACFKASWVITWLHVVLRMPWDRSVDLETVDQVRGTEVDWKLGAMITRTIREREV